MKPIDVKKQLARNVRNHVKEQAKIMKECLKDGYEYKTYPFSWSIPYKPRLGIFKLKRRSTVTFDPKTIEAYSYKHWCFVKVIKGKIVFNDYSYSNTTRRHQSMVRQLLKELSIKIDIEVNQGSTLNNGIDGSIHTLYTCIAENEIGIARKGARAITKELCKQAIKECAINVNSGSVIML